jgi:hypothetical protein
LGESETRLLLNMLMDQDEDNINRTPRLVGRHQGIKGSIDKLQPSCLLVSAKAVGDLIFSTFQQYSLFPNVLDALFMWGAFAMLYYE